MIVVASTTKQIFKTIQIAHGLFQLHAFHIVDTGECGAVVLVVVVVVVLSSSATASSPARGAGTAAAWLKGVLPLLVSLLLLLLLAVVVVVLLVTNIAVAVAAVVVQFPIRVVVLRSAISGHGRFTFTGGKINGERRNIRQRKLRL